MVGPKMQAFCPRIDMLKGNRYILRIRGAPVHQKLDMSLENKVLPHIFKIQRFPLSMSILGQKACILGPTIFKIPQPN